MKAEHRKELHTNVLAQSMKGLVEGFKASPKSTSTILWVLAILGVGTVVVWYFAGGQGSNTAPLWIKLYQDNQLDDLEKIYQENPGTIPGQTARFQQARELLQRGLEALAGPNRTQAVKDLDLARKYYAQLFVVCTDDSVLRQETMLGFARAEEALVGIPKELMPAGSEPGNLQKALNSYEDFLQVLSKVNPESALYKSLRQYVDKLKSDQDAVAKFYDRLNEEAGKKK